MTSAKQKPLQNSLASGKKKKKKIFDYTSTLENQFYYFKKGAFKWKKFHTFYVV